MKRFFGLIVGAFLFPGALMAEINPTTFITPFSGQNNGHCKLDYSQNSGNSGRDRFHLSCWSGIPDIARVVLVRGNDVLADIPAVANSNGHDYESSGYLDETAFFRQAIAEGRFEVRIDTVTGNDVARAPVGNTCGGNGFTESCLQEERFKVEVFWKDSDPNAQFQAAGSDELTLDSSLFWFFQPDNFDLMIKVFDGCQINDHFWVFAAATTNVEYDLKVTDTSNGVTQIYTNPLGVASPAITDTNAFATCP